MNLTNCERVFNAAKHEKGSWVRDYVPVSCRCRCRCAPLCMQVCALHILYPQDTLQLIGVKSIKDMAKFARPFLTWVLEKMYELF